MAEDIEAMVTEAADVVDRALRTSLTESFRSILDICAETMDGEQDRDAADQYAAEQTLPDELEQIEDDDAREACTDAITEALGDAYEAGYQAALDVLRDAIENGKYLGWAPKPALAPVA